MWGCLAHNTELPEIVPAASSTACCPAWPHWPPVPHRSMLWFDSFPPCVASKSPCLVTDSNGIDSGKHGLFSVGVDGTAHSMLPPH
jgi:hypothetical protein